MLFYNKLFSESPILGSFPLLLCIVGIITKRKVLVAIGLLILLFLLFFYRNPHSCESFPDDTIVSPSFGTVKAIKKEGDKIHIAIFLSPFDVHQQYYPINGIVKSRVYDRNGKFDIAFQMDKSRHNEKKIHTIDTQYGTVTVTQIAGFLVRAIVSDEDINTEVKAGKRFGMIKFGSRVDLELPSKDLEVYCKVGDKLSRGKIIGKYLKYQPL
jgi:phosphatidylserine decarboxylase